MAVVCFRCFCECASAIYSNSAFITFSEGRAHCVLKLSSAAPSFEPTLWGAICSVFVYSEAAIVRQRLPAVCLSLETTRVSIVVFVRARD